MVTSEMKISVFQKHKTSVSPLELKVLPKSLHWVTEPFFFQYCILARVAHTSCSWEAYFLRKLSRR